MSTKPITSRTTVDAQPAASASDCRVVFVTAPTSEARAIAHSVVQARLAACVNIIPAVSSVYRYEGNVHVDEEALLVAKTSAARVPALFAHVESIHSYDVPEIISFALDAGLPTYLKWIADAVDIES